MAWKFFLLKNDIETLEKFQRKSLRQIQGQPHTISNTITLAFLGMLPLETIIHKNSLNLFSSSVRYKHFIEYEIAERKVVMKGCEEKSWFNYFKSIFETYELLSVFSLFDQQISKPEWKEIMSNVVHSNIEATWRAEVSAKASLKYVNPDSLKV